MSPSKLAFGFPRPVSRTRVPQDEETVLNHTFKILLHQRQVAV